MIALTDDWTHWVLAGVAAWLLLNGIIVLAVYLHGRHTDEADAALTQCHCKLVEAPHDWALHEDWVQ